MDDPDLDANEHREALRGLHRLHQAGFSARLLLNAIRPYFTPDRPLRLLDVAAGGGDLLLDVAARARREGLPLECHGCDKSAVAVAQANENSERRRLDVRFFQHELFTTGQQPPSGAPYDIVTCSLFLHHLSWANGLALLKEMQSLAKTAVLVHDLRRSRLGWALAWIASRALTRSAVVHYDALVSVEGAWTPLEALALTKEAEIDGATCRTAWPERFLLEWRV